MTPSDLVNPPPNIAQVAYPIMSGVGTGVLLTCILLFVANRFDPTHGTLTISILITLGMLGSVAYCLIYTIPTDDITPGVVGGLTAGFGAVVAHWLGRSINPPNGLPPPPPPPSSDAGGQA